ncbi:predicted esterase [Brachybacterium faecium DSM 4810]|uniref:Predicted esterase n=1 Tax=Brachybacterium faecium (strain ATCC 43885 / DSM 4810 / JCM 11609 / LMG 19847 / NBRC 14762 / NCIMB 9860 / 6-10) TaxID=446465 RepID=C7MB26_BRAFD|nr:dienelactone hydrolase family protein [Brachybacterium faecium]ACU86913.1 predicted esterase [Brachybacterium faecium DSM 4810]NMB10571.1 alpha/beta fold hydrolase [Tissierellia bacterium]HJG50503.1 dienelactone hydrolase family protein [Brachybacterium faecium]
MTQMPPFTLLSPRIDEDAVVRSEPAPTAAQDAPIVLLLHGLGSHEHDLAGLVPHLPEDFRYVSLRGIHAYGPGYAWFEMPIDPQRPEAIDPAAAAVETWIAAQSEPVVGAIGFSQGGLLALHLLRRDARALDFVVNLSGVPFPAPLPGDAALAAARPPVLWGHGGRDPLFGGEIEEMTREFLSTHTQLEEERRPELGHAVDEVELRALAAFLRRRAGSSPHPGTEL